MKFAKNLLTFAHTLFHHACIFDYNCQQFIHPQYLTLNTYNYIYIKDFSSNKCVFFICDTS